MIILLFIIFLSIAIVSLVRYTKYDHNVSNDDGKFLIPFIFFSIIISTCLLVYMCNLILKVGTEHTIDQKIAIYEEENASIEKSIDRIVTNYINNEKDTYNELKSKDLVTLATMFPELKSNTLVQEQINIYVKNKEEIKYLEIKK